MSKLWGMLFSIIYTFIGGALGSLTRFLLDTNNFILFNHLSLSNIISCSLVGVIFALDFKGKNSTFCKSFIQTGFLGGLSSFTILSSLSSTHSNIYALIFLFCSLILFIIIGFIVAKALKFSINMLQFNKF